MTTNAQRQAAFRQRKKEASLEEIRGIFAKVEHHQAVKQYAAQLAANDQGKPCQTS